MLRNTTKMAFQAALAIGISEILSLSFAFDRGYWITLTAMALTTQTWGESIKRSLERVGMTILGGIAGTILYFILPKDTPHLFVLLLLCFVFFTVYLIRIYHLISVFALTCLVVFLFALLGNWDWVLLRIRIVDTILGAIIALFVGFFVFPLKTNINELLVSYLEKLKALLATVFENKKICTLVTRQNLSSDLQKVRKSALSIRYELFFHRLKPVDFNAALNSLIIATRYTFNLSETAQWLFPYLSKEEKDRLTMAYQITQENLMKLVIFLKEGKPQLMCGSETLSHLLEQSIKANPQAFAKLETNLVSFYSLLYFFVEVNTHISEINRYLAKA